MTQTIENACQQFVAIIVASNLFDTAKLISYIDIITSVARLSRPFEPNVNKDFTLDEYKVYLKNLIFIRQKQDILLIIFSLY